MVDNNCLKAFLRVNFKNLKANIPKDIKDVLDNKIKSKIINLKEYLESDSILAYMANNFEINIDDIISFSINNGKKVAIPKCNNFNDDIFMNYYFIENIKNTSIGKFSIREPNNKCKIFNCNNNKGKVVMFVPGLVYDRYGYRIGYGKGYYDKYLDKNDIFKIGLCYNIAVIDKIPRSSNDIPVDILITEKDILTFKH